MIQAKVIEVAASLTLRMQQARNSAIKLKEI